MANLPHIRLYRVGTAAALIVAPLLLLIGNVIHPKEVGRGNELEQVGLIADAYARSQAAHVIGWGIAGELSANSLGQAGAAEVLSDLQGSEWSLP
jgi:hypothetical protein